MEIKSLGFKSELIFLEFDGEVVDRGAFVVVKTPTNPGYYWGNLLIFGRPPIKGDFRKWTALFDSEFSGPETKHKTLAWDSPTNEVGDISEFLSANYRLDSTAVLSAKADQIFRPAKYNDQIQIRELESDSDWREHIELQTSTGEAHLTRDQWLSFNTDQSVRYRKMIAADRGAWFGAYLDGKLVASMGLFHSKGVGRYQMVATAIEHRRQGIAATMVYEVAKHAFQNWNVKDLVMCADPDYFAIKIYESVGFKRSGLQHGVYWWQGKPVA